MNQEYIQSLFEQNKRTDLRKLDQFREVIIETGISKNAEGSARCKIGDTEVVVGVKMDIGTPYPDSPDEGSIIVTAELSPLASPDFESGPPGPWATELARIVDRGIRESKSIDLKSLCVKEGEKVWLLFIDIYPMNDDGNLIDASVLATLAALKKMKFTKLEDGKVKYGEFTDQKLKMVREPVTVTIYKSGKNLFVDPNTNEEKAANARLSISVDNGKIYALQKGGSDSFSLEEIDKMVDMAFDKEKALRTVLNKVK